MHLRTVCLIGLAGLLWLGCQSQDPVSQLNSTPQTGPSDSNTAPVDTSNFVNIILIPKDTIAQPKDTVITPRDTASTITITSLTATPSIVPPGGTAVVECKASGGNGATINYKWESSGAVGYIIPKNSICIFASPSCHSGPATVTVTVSSGTSAPVSQSVNLN